MSTIALWWLIAFLGVCALLGLLAERRRVGKKLARFQDRENLALDEIYRRYYVNSGLPQNSVLNVWRDLAKNLGVAPGLLRPDDRFDCQLAPEKGFPTEDELADVAAYVKDHAGGLDVQLGSFQTLNDAVIACTSKIAE